MAGQEANGKTNVVTIERDRYEKILIELGELRKLNEFVEQYKRDLEAKQLELKAKDRELEEVKEILLETEWKDYELEHTQKRIRELELEVERLRASRPWWKKLFWP